MAHKIKCNRSSGKVSLSHNRSVVVSFALGPLFFLCTTWVQHKRQWRRFAVCSLSLLVLMLFSGVQSKSNAMEVDGDSHQGIKGYYETKTEQMRVRGLQFFFKKN